MSFFPVKAAGKNQTSPSETVIHAFATTQLDYCNALYMWGQWVLHCLSSTGTKCCCTSFNWHISPIFASLHWLPNVLPPPYLSELLHLYTRSRSLRSADQLLLTLPEGLSPEGTERLSLQLQNFGMDCRCTLDRPPLCLILKLLLKHTSCLWLLAPCRVLILCVYMYSFICFIFLCSTLLTLCLLKSCYGNKVD